MHWHLASLAALGSLALAVPTEHVDKCAITGQDKGTIAKSTSSPFNVTKSADDKGILDCNYDFSSGVTWVTKGKMADSFLKQATNTGKTFSDGSYTGTVYTANVSWWRPLGTNGENSEQTYIDPTYASIDLVVTDAQLPYYAYCLIGLLPGKEDAPAKSLTSSLKSQGLIDKEKILYFGGQFVQWGADQPSDYAWKSLQLAKDKQDFTWNSTIPATFSDNNILVNASLVKPETSEKKSYPAFFNMSDPVTYVPVELADEVWPSYVNVSRVPSHDGNTITYFWNCSIASYAQTQDFKFLFEIATHDKPYTIKESSWTIQNGQCEGLLKGRKSAKEIAFGSAVLDNMGIAIDHEASNIAFGSIPGYSSFKPDTRQTC